nr:reverse transcriptase domain-containing protein [Tanacetum cinerariifolium]
MYNKFRDAFQRIFKAEERTFKSGLSRNMQNLERQLYKETLHEKDLNSDLRVIKVQFEQFIHSKVLEPSNHNSYDLETRRDFKEYTQMEAQTFKETIIQNMNSIEQSLQTQTCKVQEVQALNASLRDKDCNRIVSDKGNDQGLENQSNTSGDESKCDDERVALANLIATLKLNVDENKKIQKQLKKANTTLAQELKECKSILAETSRTLGESNSIRDKKHSISLKLALQQCQEQMKNDTVCKEKASNVFQKEHEQYFEIQDLKAQLQDKNIAISELNKLIEKMEVGVSNDLTKPITPHSWPHVRKSSFAKPYDVNAHGPSKKSPKHVSFQTPREFIGSNDMVHNYYLEEAKKKAQLQKDKALNIKPSVQQSTRLPNTANGGNQRVEFSRQWVLDGFLLERYSPLAQPRLTVSPQMVQMQISLTNMNANKLLMSVHALYLSAYTSFNTKKDGLRVWLQKRMISQKPGLQEFSIDEHVMTSDHNSSKLEIYDHSNEKSSSKLVPKVIPSANKIATSRQELELLFYHHITVLRSSSTLSRDQTFNPTSSTNPTPKGRIRRSSKQKLENSNFEENPLPPIPMAENQTMVQLLQAPTDGYEDAIVIPEIAATNFELKHGLINLVQNKQFFGHEKEDPHAHLRYFNKITSTMRVLNFFPPSKTTNLRNEITRFQQRFDESFYEAWDHINDLLRACPHHGFFELHQLDTFYNALNVNDQDSLNYAAGENFLDKMPADCLKIIESKSKVRQTRAKAVVAKVSSNSSTPAVSSDVAELKDMVRALLLDKKNQYSAQTSSPTPTPIKVVEPNCVTCGAPVQPMVTQSESKTLVSEPVVAPVSAPMPNLKPSIPYPSRHDNERRRDQANEQIEKFYEIFKEMSFEISFTDALMLMSKFSSTLKALIGNKEKLRMDECLALADIGASINLMPLFVWKGLSLLELTPTCMTLELADRTESKPVGIAKYVKVKVGMFHFPADFVGELTLRIRNEAITYNLDQTSRYSANYDQMTANKINVTDEACEEYSQEVLGFSDATASGSPVS